MPRTTAELVAGIIQVDATIPLDPFILTANELVTEKCGALVPPYTDVRLELIERYLSAHFYTLRDPRTTEETAGPVRAEYQSAVALGLQTSHYGQTALQLDTSGALAALNHFSNTGPGKRTISVYHAARNPGRRAFRRR